MDDSILDSEPTTTNPLLNLAGPSSSDVSPLEQEVLDEYSRLLENMNQLSSTLSVLATGPITTEVADGLRLLERKVTSVYTLMKASVYSIVLQQGHMDGDGGGNEDGNGGGGVADNGEGNTTIGVGMSSGRRAGGGGRGGGGGVDESRIS